MPSKPSSAAATLRKYKLKTARVARPSPLRIVTNASDFDPASDSMQHSRNSSTWSKDIMAAAEKGRQLASASGTPSTDKEVAIEHRADGSSASANAPATVPCADTSTSLDDRVETAGSVTTTGTATSTMTVGNTTTVTNTSTTSNTTTANSPTTADGTPPRATDTFVPAGSKRIDELGMGWFDVFGSGGEFLGKKYHYWIN